MRPNKPDVHRTFVKKDHRDLAAEGWLLLYLLSVVFAMIVMVKVGKMFYNKKYISKYEMQNSAYRTIKK